MKGLTLMAREKARARFLGHLQSLGEAETISTKDACDRVLFRDATSLESMPPFSRSAMDGYALRAADVFSTKPSCPVTLEVAGEVLMGQASTVNIRKDQAALIHTGGMIPSGADAVVMVENTRVIPRDRIEVLNSPVIGENILKAGEDFTAGEKVLSAGCRLSPADLGVLLEVGITQIEVARRPRVAIFASGAELVGPNDDVCLGKIRDINSHILACRVERAGGIALRKGILPDDLDALTVNCKDALKEVDMLVLSGGSSVSVRDLTANVFERLGSPGILVHGLAIKPGKPTILAVADGKPCVGLPGNPASALLLFDFVGVPAILQLQGAEAEPFQGTVRARLAARVTSVVGREDYIPIRWINRLIEQGGEETKGQRKERWAEPLPGRGNTIFRLATADGLLRVPLNSVEIEVGETIDIEPI